MSVWSFGTNPFSPVKTQLNIFAEDFVDHTASCGEELYYAFPALITLWKGL